jgi:hypothetical protein
LLDTFEISGEKVKVGMAERKDLILNSLQPGKPLIKKAGDITEGAYEHQNTYYNQQQAAYDLNGSEVLFHPAENTQKGIEAHRGYEKGNPQTQGIGRKERYSLSHGILVGGQKENSA